MSTRSMPKQRHDDKRSELGFGSRRATSSDAGPSQASAQFDSLQQLLEDAGYKETRIFTPLMAKTHASPPSVTKTRVASRTRRDAGNAATSKQSGQHNVCASASPPSTVGTVKQTGTDVDRAKAIAANSSWFNASWSTITGRGVSSSTSSLRKKQSEPALSKRANGASSGWSTSSWWSSRDDARSGQAHSPPLAETSPQTVQQHPSAANSTNEAPSSDGAVSSSSCARPTLRHAPSTQHLWQASVKHHRETAQKVVHRSRSFPAKISVVEPRRPTAALNRKQSFDGARLVSGVGVRAATRNGTLSSDDDVFVAQHGKHGIGVRHAFKSVTADDALLEQEHWRAQRASTNDSISSLTDVEDLGQHIENVSSMSQTSAQDVAAVDDVFASAAAAVAPALTRSNATERPTELFAIPAAPLLSLNGAVAMRNSACLEFSTSPPSSTQSTGRLRKMRSVDALELALARMQAKKAASQSSFRESAIPESSSADSIVAEDFANAKTTDIGNNNLDANSDDIRRCPTPTLVITSPTGVRPPQPLLLDGIEFEPRSVSPKGAGTIVVRPVAKRTGWKISVRKSADAVEESAVKDGATEHRGRSESSRPLPIRNPNRATKARSKSKTNDDEAHLQAPALRKRGTTKSCGNLRRAAERGADMASIRSGVGKLSMSEQIHALHRSVQERSRSLASEPACIPRSPTEHDADDPFNDFVAVAAKMSVSRDGSAGDKANGPSPVPFERPKSRSPLGQSTTASNGSSAIVEAKASTKPAKSARTTEQPIVAGTVLNSKRSGVGLACLVDLDQHPVLTKRNSAASKPSQSSALGRARRGNSSSSTTSDSPSRSSPASRLHGMASLDGADNFSTLPMMLFNDENIDPNLDSPTARVGHRALKRRNSRPRVL